MQLGVARGDEGILVVVSDENRIQPEQQPYSDERSDGRGIVLLSALADRWGVDHVEGGKAVWFTLRLVPPLEERTG